MRVKKRIILSMLYTLLCIILITLPAFASMKNEPDGFRGIPWKTTLTENGAKSADKWGLEEDIAIAEPTVQIYGRKNEKLSFGDAEIFSVHYFFQKRLGFAKVQISAEGYRNFELIRKECISSWGEPDGERRIKDKSSDETHIHWSGRKVIVLLVYDRGQNDITLYIYQNNYYQTVRSDEDALGETQKNP